MAKEYQLLIGGLGDDAHSIGIGLLAIGFRELGFNVFNLGIRNTLADFFRYAEHFDVIMMSNKNGHAEIYLQQFPRLLSEFQLQHDDVKLWYLGGSLSVSESDFSIKKRFLSVGFTNVYPKPVAFRQIEADIRRDMVRCNIPKRDSYLTNRKVAAVAPIDCSDLSDEQCSEHDLSCSRKLVLNDWKTGKEVDLQRFEAPRHSMDKILWERKVRSGEVLLQPRTGVADINEQISKLEELERSGSNISSVQLDAACRSRLYDRAAEFIEVSLERKQSVLNGFPLPVYGVKEVRRMVDSLNNPFQLRAGGPDHRFTYEIALQAGVSGLEGGAICYLMPYDKSTSPKDSIRNWQYVDRLCALYERHTGVSINREYFGVLTATLIEPSIPVVVNIIQALLSAQQGVKSISVGYAEQGNRAQDIAAIRALESSVQKYLTLYGFRDCRVTTVFHQYMAAFPSDYAKSEDLIFNSCITASLANATRVMVKTAVESQRIPSTLDNVKALGLCKKAILSAKDIHAKMDAIRAEKDLITSEVDQIMRAVIELGNGAISVGVVKAIEEGIIDIFWSPNIYNRNKVTSIRDISGAIRFLDFGNLPFDEKTKSFHHEKTLIRKNMERDSSLFSLLEKDLSRIWQNDYKNWPLDDMYVN
ncbi:MAG: methylaspartate mutase subunit E [Chitinophagaceae bacterium]|nr:methylaspartate mutase subunit E [Chitinophagaceae bacterium]